LLRELSRPARDGDLDVAVTEVGKYSVITALITLGNGDGTFRPGASYRMPPGGLGHAPILAADFNHEGFLDLAVTGCGGVCILLGRGDSTFTSPRAFSTGATFDTPCAAIALGDFNQDGNLGNFTR
jgi:FG-GAP-like repeat